MLRVYDGVFCSILFCSPINLSVHAYDFKSKVGCGRDFGPGASPLPQWLHTTICIFNFSGGLAVRPTHNALLHLALERSVCGLESTQHSVHSKSWALKCTQHSLHSKQWALSTQCTHLLGTKVPVWASCVVPCAREPRRPPWASLSLSLPLTRALPRLDLPLSVLSCDVRWYMPKPSGANWIFFWIQEYLLRSNLSKRSMKH